MGKKIQDLTESFALLEDDDVLIKSGAQDYKITAENFRKTLGTEGEDVALTGTTYLPAVTDAQLLADAVGEHEGVISRSTQTDYTALIAAHASEAYEDGDVVTLTDAGIAEQGTVIYSVGHGITATVGVNVRLDDDYYWRRDYSGRAQLIWFALADGSDQQVNISLAIEQVGDNLEVTSGYTFSFGSSINCDRAVVDIAGSGTLAGLNRNSALTYSDNVTTLKLSDFTLKNCAGSQTTGSTTSVIEKCTVKNVTVEDSEIGIHLLGAVSDALFEGNTFKNLNRTVLSQSCQGIKIGNNNRSSALLTKKVRIVNNTFENIVNDFAQETHAFLVYGIEVHASGNETETVYNSDNSGCEAYYFKSDVVTCIGNTVKNANTSDDGMINFKGGPEGDTGQVTGQNITCIGNTLVNTDTSILPIGISCTDEHANITGNTLTNCIFRAFSGSDMLFSNNTVNITLDSGSVLWFEVENANQVTFKNNKVKVTVSSLTANTAQCGRVRASAADVEDFKFIGNEMDLTFSTTVGSNTIAALTLWAENNDITGAVIKGNELKLSAPSSTAIDRQLIYFSGTNAISAKIQRNEGNIDGIYYDDNSYSNRTVEFDSNTVNDINLTSSNKGFENKVSDVRVKNSGATAARTVTLPAARVGISKQLYCDSQTYNMPVTADGSDAFVDGATTKTLAVGASMSVRCFSAGVWTITSSHGSIT